MKALAAAAFAAVLLLAALVMPARQAGAQSTDVQNFRCVNQGSNVLCTWDAVGGTRFYILVDSNDGGSSTANRYIVSGGSTSHVISNRNTDTWVFRIQADNNAPTAWTQSTAVQPTATPTATPTPTPTATPVPQRQAGFEAEVRDGRTYFSWPDLAEGSLATEWVLEWRYSYSTRRYGVDPSEVSTPVLSGGTWTADTSMTFTWDTIYWTVRHGLGERSPEVRLLYVRPTPTATADPDAPVTATPTATPIPGAIGQDGGSAVAVVMVPRIQDSRNFWIFIAVVATALSALGLQRVKFPYPGEVALFVGIVCVVVAIIKTGLSPLILLLGIGFGVALVILLLRVNK